jgi:hypothetical protein
LIHGFPVSARRSTDFRLRYAFKLCEISVTTTSRSERVSSLWHGRLGHLTKAGIMHLSKVGYIPKLSFSISFASIASTASKSRSHIRLVRRENRVRSIWSIRTSVALCHIRLSAECHTSSPSSTTLRGRWGLIRLGQKIVFLRSSRISSQWSRIRRIGS